MQQKHRSTAAYGSVLIIAIDRDKFSASLCVSDGLIPKLHKSPLSKHNHMVSQLFVTSCATVYLAWLPCPVEERLPPPPF